MACLGEEDAWEDGRGVGSCRDVIEKYLGTIGTERVDGDVAEVALTVMVSLVAFNNSLAPKSLGASAPYCFCSRCFCPECRYARKPQR